MLRRRHLAYLTLPLGACAIGLIGVFLWQGLEAAWLTLVLLVLEISLSFDNAVVNARVLERLTPSQQRFFLTWGLVIPVFGVRFAGPLLMVSLAGGVSLPAALQAALHDPIRYRELLELAEPRILAFGGMFLLMVFLRYFFDDAKTLHWFRPLERRLSQAGRVEALEIALALGLLLLVVLSLPASLRGEVMIAGVIGLVLQLLSTSLAEVFSAGGDPDAPRVQEDRRQGATLRESNFQAVNLNEARDHLGQGPAARALDRSAAGLLPARPLVTGPGLTTARVGRAAMGSGLASLLYLELLDASFSLDGTIGAFAITQNLGLILTGLGLGALFIRSLTLLLSREKALDQLVFLEHGAHYAIGALGVVMLLQVLLNPQHLHIPEGFTGLVGIVLLLLATLDSRRHRRRTSQSSPQASPARSHPSKFPPS